MRVGSDADRKRVWRGAVSKPFREATLGGPTEKRPFLYGMVGGGLSSVEKRTTGRCPSIFVRFPAGGRDAAGGSIFVGPVTEDIGTAAILVAGKPARRHSLTPGASMHAVGEDG